MRLAICVAVAGSLLLAACTESQVGSDAGNPPPSSTSTSDAPQPESTSSEAAPTTTTLPGPPPPETALRTMTLEPQNPAPGSEFTASFARRNERGGYFFLEVWDGDRWVKPVYVLESDANDGPPSANVIGTGDMLAYGVAGPGPDGLILPPGMGAGYWRICGAMDRSPLCAQFTVGPDTPELIEPESTADLVCERDLDEIVLLMRSGLSPYDYVPVGDLVEMSQSSDRTVVGTIDSLVPMSAQGESSGAGNERRWTIISSVDADFLYPAYDPAEIPRKFSIRTTASDDGGAATAPVELSIDGLEYITFLRESAAAPGGFEVRPQGLLVSCVGSDEPGVAVIDPMPSGAGGLSVDAVAEILYRLY